MNNFALFYLGILGLAAGLLPLTIAQRVLASENVRLYIVDHCRTHTIITSKRKICYSIYHPNVISSIRTLVCLSAVVLYIFFPTYFAVFLFIFGAGLDAVDGIVARACGLTTKFGEIFDPLCDKCCYLIPIIYFSHKVTILGYVFAVIELSGQFFVRRWLSKRDKSVAANIIGKIKAALAFSNVPYLFLIDAVVPLPDFIFHLLLCCVILSVLSSICKMQDNLALILKFIPIPKRHYANIFSSLNLLCGIIGCICAVKGLFIYNILSIMSGQFFDLFDGRMARIYGGTPIGAKLDDVADLVSFGLDPALTLKYTAKHAGNNGLLPLIIATLYVSAIAFRLIRFLIVDKKRKDLPEGIFSGLPSPGGATLILGAAPIYINIFGGWALWIITILISYLAISKIEFTHCRKILYRLKDIPKPYLIISATLFCASVAYNMKHKSSLLLPWILFIGGIAYIIIGKIIKPESNISPEANLNKTQNPVLS